jgi:hypothetical protein
MPLADVNNLLGKRPTPHTPSSPSTPGKKPTGTPKRHKRRRMDIDLDYLTVQNQSPISDHSSSGDRGQSGVGCLKRMALTGDGIHAPTSQVSEELRAPLPLPSVTSGNPLSLLAKDMPTTPSGDAQVIVVSDAATVTEQSQIADKLSPAWSDLVAPSYAQRRTRRLSRSRV